MAGRQHKQVPKRVPLPANLTRREIHREPESITCACGCQMKRIGGDVANTLDCMPGLFTLERRIRGKRPSAKYETLTEVPEEAQVIG